MKGLVVRNIHVQYENPISSGLKVMAKVNFFKSRTNFKVKEEKMKQVTAFSDKLCKFPKGTVFAESTYDDFWGTGVDRDGTDHTQENKWPGKNHRAHYTESCLCPEMSSTLVVKPERL